MLFHRNFVIVAIVAVFSCVFYVAEAATRRKDDDSPKNTLEFFRGLGPAVPNKDRSRFSLKAQKIKRILAEKKAKGRR